jgi:hypothetical protein
MIVINDEFIGSFFFFFFPIFREIELLGYGV